MSILTGIAVPHPPIILHEVGRGEEKKIQSTIDAYDKAMKLVASLEPETVILLSPHSTVFHDYFHISPGFSAKGNLSMFGASHVEIEVEYDQNLANKICELATVESIPAGTFGEKDPMLDHGSLIPLYFLKKHYTDFKVVRISPSGLSSDVHHSFGKCINSAVESLDKNVVIIASGDLSHKLKTTGPYGYAEEGPIFDEKIINIFHSGKLNELLKLDDILCNNAAECGLKPFQIMAGSLSESKIIPSMLSYEGPFGVGYAVATFEVMSKSIPKHKEEDEYVKLAKKTIEHYIVTGKRTNIPDDVSSELLYSKAGVFVSLKKHGELRGCIGTISPNENCIAEEIIQNAISASSCDPRFSAVKEHELDHLEYSVDVLGQAEPIDSFDKLDVNRYGVIVQKGHRRGLLLPNLEGIDTVEKQVDIARQKAGVMKGEKYNLLRFEVVRHK